MKLTKEDKILVIQRMRMLKTFSKIYDLDLGEYHAEIKRVHPYRFKNKFDIFMFIYLERWNSNLFDRTLTWSVTKRGSQFWRDMNDNFLNYAKKNKI